jgi:hypothetical protein
MISTTTLRQITRGPAINALRRAVTHQATPALTNIMVTPIVANAFTGSPSPRFNSTMAVPIRELGKVEKTLKALDMAVVRQIKAELMEVDANSDGRQVTNSNC